MGYLVPDKGLIKVYAPFTGVIETNYIKAGQKVKKGDVLLQISTRRGLSSGSSVNQLLLDQLENQEILLAKRIDDEVLLNVSEESRLKLSYANTQAEIKQFKQQVTVQQQQFENAQQAYFKYKKLHLKNFVTDTELNTKKNNALAFQAILELTKSQIIVKTGTATNIEKQQEQLPLRHHSKLQELENSLSLLKQKTIELKSGESYIIKASVDGRVTALQVNVGQVVSVNISLLTIIPDDAKLTAELFLPSRAIGFVKKEQKVLIKFDAFPYQQFGLYEGEISQISQSIISANEAGIPLSSNQPIYRLKVKLKAQHITVYGKNIELQSGMQLTANIILEKRSLGQWLLAPVYSLKGGL